MQCIVMKGNEESPQNFMDDTNWLVVYYWVKMVMAFYSGLGSVSNNVAECDGVLKGMKWCVQRGYVDVIIESDSMNIIKMIKEELTPPWQLVHLIEEINVLKLSGSFTFQHSYREANMIADMMANFGEQQQGKKFFTSALTMPNQVKVGLKSDQRGMPSFKIRQKKGHFVVNDNG